MPSDLEEVTRLNTKATSMAHYQRKSYYRENFREGVSPDMTEGMVAATTFNASHQTSWLHLCGEDP